MARILAGKSMTAVMRGARRRAGLAVQTSSRNIRRPAAARWPTLLIVGCQRSGTSALLKAFDEDPDIAVFGELGMAFGREEGNHRLRSLPTVRRQMAASGAALSVIKPLVESHRMTELLDALPGAHAIWMYRRYDDVASSNLRRFGTTNGRRDLDLALHGHPGDWRFDGTDGEDRRHIEQVWSEDLGDHDAAALFWWLRNQLFFRHGLIDDDRIRLCSYDELTADPADTIGSMYDFVGLAKPTDLGSQIHRRSVHRGSGIDVAPRVLDLCEEMLGALNNANAVSGLRAAR